MNIEGMIPMEFVKGDYVLATKWSDGDPRDHWCVGFYSHTVDHFGQPRHIVVDSDGQSFRHNGFRKMMHVSARRGEFLVRNAKLIEGSGRLFGHWLRVPMTDSDSEPSSGVS